MISTALLFLAQAPANAPQPPSSSSMFIPLLAMGVIFYFLLIRPQQKRQKELQKMISELKTGDKVITTGGIHGIIANVKDGATLSLKIADNVKIEVDKSAIATIDRGGAAPAAAAAAKA
jgi:preprotein translocase subunit YajC